jgi:hypothetical protein
MHSHSEFVLEHRSGRKILYVYTCSQWGGPDHRSIAGSVWLLGVGTQTGSLYASLTLSGTALYRSLHGLQAQLKRCIRKSAGTVIITSLCKYEQ